jgi:hypothetical protein
MREEDRAPECRGCHQAESRTGEAGIWQECRYQGCDEDEAAGRRMRIFKTRQYAAFQSLSRVYVAEQGQRLVKMLLILPGLSGLKRILRERNHRARPSLRSSAASSRRARKSRERTEDSLVLSTSAT